MDVFQHRYYRLNKIMMTVIGQWPFCSTRTRHAFSAILIFFVTFHILFRILAVVKYRNDTGVLMDLILPGLIDALFATKFISFVKNSQNTLQLLNRIRTDWQVWARDEEICILHAHAKQGKLIATVYAVMMFSGVQIFVSPLVIPKIIDVLLRNGTEPGKFPYPAVYYHVDEQKYYFYIITFCYVCSYIIMSVIVTDEVMLISYVHHSSGVFTALGHKLERIGNDNASVETGKTPYARDKTDMLHITSCIDRHNDAIVFVNTVEANYTWTFFFSLVFGMFLIIITALQILRVKNDPSSFIRFTMVAFGVLLNFYVDCHFAQSLIDRSIGIHFSTHNNQWYKLSVKAQKLLQFMTMRSSVPCVLTAGKMFVMSIRTYGLTVRTIISYLTFARSLEGI